MDNQHYTNVPFEIPSSWEWVKLGDYVNVINGKSQKAVVDKNGEYPIYGSGGVMGYANRYLCHENSTIIGRKGTIDNPIFVTTKFWNVDTAFGMEPSECINPLFFFYFCKSYNFKKLDKSTTLPSLTKSNIEQIFLPLPPLFEQQRIVAEIERWFAVIDNLEESKQDLQAAIKQTRAKVLDLAIHGKLVSQDPNDEPASELLKRINPHYTPCDTSHYENALFEIPQSWAWVKIDDVLTLMNGYAFKSSQYISDDGVRIIRITNVQDGYVCDDDPKFYPNSLLDEYTPFLLKEGDLLMSLTGNVGRVGLLPKEMLPAALNQRVACFREKQSLGYLRYIFYLMRSTFFIEACVASGNATAQLNISTNWLKSFRIPLPPLAEQQRIIAKIESIFEILDSIEDSIC